MPLAQFGFRSGFMNPYKHDPIQVDEKIREQQAAKPVWDRVFDH